MPSLLTLMSMVLIKRNILKYFSGFKGHASIERSPRGFIVLYLEVIILFHQATSSICDSGKKGNAVEAKKH